ncbi:MAG TPA: threonine/serine dehydratase [Rariglobus sp.]|jgi:threonine dehydratase|nr:threonine/serine dehydratase [Rariglobus sp.]
MNTPLLTLDDVLQAQTRLAGGVRVTPCAPSARLSELAGMQIIAKHDYLQATGSFKERGARHALALLTPAQRARGVVAASAGNHALGLAFHGRELGVPVTVVMPRNAPRVKASRCHTLGAHVVLHGDTYDEASLHAQALANHHGLAYVHPFDDLAVIAGQGTLALEALFAEPDVDAVVVPVGGGGLLSGVATVVKALRPDVQVIGVEPVHAAGLVAARNAGRPVRTFTLPTLADGLAVAQTGVHTFAHAHAFADHVVTVTEDDLALALLAAHEAHGVTLEGAGATGLAACLAGRLPTLAGKRVLVALTGANIDPANHARALTRARVLRSEMIPA